MYVSSESEIWLSPANIIYFKFLSLYDQVIVLLCKPTGCLYRDYRVRQIMVSCLSTISTWHRNDMTMSLLPSYLISEVSSLIKNMLINITNCVNCYNF